MTTVLVVLMQVFGGHCKAILLKEADLNKFSLIHITLIFTQDPAAERRKYDGEAWTKS